MRMRRKIGATVGNEPHPQISRPGKNRAIGEGVSFCIRHLVLTVNSRTMAHNGKGQYERHTF